MFFDAFFVLSDEKNQRKKHQSPIINRRLTIGLFFKILFQKII